MPALKIKFGKSTENLAVEGRDEIDILARRGNGPWVRVGWVDVDGYQIGQWEDRCVVGEYTATLFDVAEEHNVVIKENVLRCRYGGIKLAPIMTPAEGKRLIKAWAVEALADSI
jgi:hypothetical protein